jgi:hypothetical protein
MALAVTTVATSIAALSVSGVTMKDLDAIPEAVLNRDCPIFYPKPENFMTNLRVEILSFGTGSSAKKNVTYQLNYMYLHSELGAGRSLLDVYPDVVAKAALIIDAFLGDDALTGTIDIKPQTALTFGPVQDVAGNWFHGSNMTFDVLEFWS